MVYLGQECVLAMGLAVAGFRGWYRVGECEAIEGLPGARLPGMVFSSCTRSPMAALSKFLSAYLSRGEEEEGHFLTEVVRESSLPFKIPSFSSSSPSAKTDC